MNIDSATSSVVAKLQALKEQNSKDLEKNASDIKSTGRKSSEEIRQKKQMQQIIEARDLLQKAINGSDADFTYQPPAASSAALTRSDLAALAGKLGQPNAPQQQKNNVSLYNSFVAVLLEIVENMLNSTDLILSYQQAAYKGNAQVLKNSAEMAATNFSMASTTLSQANQAASQQMSAALFSTITSGLGLAQFMKSLATPRGLQQQFQEFTDQFKQKQDVMKEVGSHKFPEVLSKKISEHQVIQDEIKPKIEDLGKHENSATKLEQDLNAFFEQAKALKDPKKVASALKDFIEQQRKNIDVSDTIKSLNKPEHIHNVSTASDDHVSAQIKVKDETLKQQLNDAGFIEGPISGSEVVIDLKSMMKQDPKDPNKVHCLVPNPNGCLEHMVFQKHGAETNHYVIMNRTKIGDDPAKADLIFKSKDGSNLSDLTHIEKRENLEKLMRVGALTQDRDCVEAVFGKGDLLTKGEINEKISELQMKQRALERYDSDKTLPYPNDEDESKIERIKKEIRDYEKTRDLSTVRDASVSGNWNTVTNQTFKAYMKEQLIGAYKHHQLAQAEHKALAPVQDLFTPAGFGQEEKLVQKIERMLHTAATDAATSTDRTGMFVSTVAPGFVGIASGQSQQASQQAMALSQQTGTQANAIMQQNDAQLKTLQQVVGDFLNTANTSLEKMIEMVISTVAMAARSFESH